MANVYAGAGTGAATGAAAGSAVLPGWGTAIGAGVGALAGAYGSYVQSQAADQDYQRALLAWRDEQERQKRMDAQNAQAQALQGNLAVGNYAQGQVRDAGQAYSDYARSLGIR